MPLQNNPSLGIPVAWLPYMVQTVLITTPTWTAVTANTTSEQTMTVSGVTTDDMVVSVNKPTHQAGLGIVGMRVSAANTVALTFMNNTGSNITPTAAEVYPVAFTRKQ